MKKLITLVAVMMSSSLALASTTTLTVEGQIAKVVPAKTEIYVKSDKDGKKYEYYFNDKTVLTRGATAAQFSELKPGMKVRVEANKVGKRLDPLKVEILE